MSTSAAPPTAEHHEAVSTTPAPQGRSEPRRTWVRLRRFIALALLVGLIAIGLPHFLGWVEFRRTHSITDDAFVEAHIVNVAPQLVSGRIIRFLADENDRVSQGQVLAEVDPIAVSRQGQHLAGSTRFSRGRARSPARRPGARSQRGPDPDRNRPADLRCRRG